MELVYTLRMLQNSTLQDVVEHFGYEWLTEAYLQPS